MFDKKVALIDNHTRNLVPSTDLYFISMLKTD